MTGDVHRYGFPSSDLKVKLDSVSIALAFGGWVAFKTDHGSTMGDLVLLETEINPVNVEADRRCRVMVFDARPPFGVIRTICKPTLNKAP